MARRLDVAACGPEAVAPEEAGLDAGRLERLGEMLEAGRSQGLFAGGLVAVLRGGAVAGGAVVGSLGLGADAASVSEQTVWDLASLSKPMATAASALALAEDGRLYLNREVGEFFPGSDAPWLAGITLRHLLTHTSGLPAWGKFHSRSLSREEIIAAALATHPHHRPGHAYIYSDIGYILLGAVVERVSGQSLADFARERVWEPLGMRDTTFCPPATWQDRTAACYCPARETHVVGEVHDPNCWAMGGVAGHAGVFATLADVARFASMFMNESGEGAGVLGPLALRRMAEPQIEPSVGGHSYGFFTRRNGMLPAGDFLPDDAFGHTGYTGTSLVVVPSLRLAVILLTNRVCPPDYLEQHSVFLEYRRRFHNLATSCIRS